MDNFDNFINKFDIEKELVVKLQTYLFENQDINDSVVEKANNALFRKLNEYDGFKLGLLEYRKEYHFQFRTALGEHQEHLDELKNVSANLDKVTQLQQEMGIALTNRRNSPEAEREFGQMLSFLKEKQVRVLEYNEMIRQGATSRPSPQYLLDEVRKDQLAALSSFNALQQARKRNEPSEAKEQQILKANGLFQPKTKAA